LGGEWRLKKLNQHIFATGGGGTDDVYIDPLKAVRPVRLPVLLSTSGTIVTAIANGMGSASLLISFPQYFLGLYMLGSSFISWWSKTNRQSNDGYFIGRFVQWLGEEGTLSCSRYTNDATTTTTGGCGVGGHIDSPWKLSTRLVALYWITILSKTLLALIVICRNDATGSTRWRGELRELLIRFEKTPNGKAEKFVNAFHYVGFSGMLLVCVSGGDLWEQMTHHMMMWCKRFFWFPESGISDQLPDFSAPLFDAYIHKTTHPLDILPDFSTNMPKHSTVVACTFYPMNNNRCTSLRLMEW